jgi:WD40 repeat protein
LQDNTVRVWLLNPEKGTVSCVGVGERHTASVGALSFSQLTTTWLLSAARDECLKAWRLPENIAGIVFYIVIYF